jgi:histone H3/H4
MSNSDTNTASEIGHEVSSVDAADVSEALVVVSKVKKLIRAKSGLNTGQCAIEALTRKVAAEISRGIESARKAGRKTVMGRDIL